MKLLSRLRCVTVDVTGTLIAYKGELGDYYCTAAKSVGLPCPDYKRVHEGFKLAYSELSKKHPCFGYAVQMPNIVWWKRCVRDSFGKTVDASPRPITSFMVFAGEAFNANTPALLPPSSTLLTITLAGYHYEEEIFDKIFKCIYACYGSSAPYTVFPDSIPFLRWVREKGIPIGLVSNGDYRYQDLVLPALGLNQGSEWDFSVLSGFEGVEKPDHKIYEIALERAGNIAPEEVLHIGDSMRKDYLPAKSLGMHALLLDRFRSSYAENLGKSGALVLPDLTAVQELLNSHNLTCRKNSLFFLSF
ncbi:hypothetical protein Ancab_019583 [Ancistrocladus abbreviatus]